MNAIPTTVSVPLATLCALELGFAIQRGAMCTVAAVNQIVVQRRFSRLQAPASAALLLAALAVALAVCSLRARGAGARHRLVRCDGGRAAQASWSPLAGMWRQRVLWEQT